MAHKKEKMKEEMMESKGKKKPTAHKKSMMAEKEKMAKKK